MKNPIISIWPFSWKDRTFAWRHIFGLNKRGFNLKKTNITMKSRFGFYWVLLGFIGFYWVLLDIFEKFFFKFLLAHCYVTQVHFKIYFSHFILCLGWFFWLKLKFRMLKLFCVRTVWNPYEEVKKNKLASNYQECY